MADLLAGCPRLTLLATSQARLALTDEQRIQVPPLGLPRELSGPFADLIGAPSVELFVSRALRFDADQTFDATDLHAIANIVSGLDGMPLAIELAAARTTTLTPVEIARLMSDRFDLLSTGRPNAPDRQQSLWAAVEWSYNLLSEDDQDIFTRLSICVGGFELATAAHLAGLSEAVVANGLHRLIGSSLLTRLASPTGATRYRLLESLRQYGADVLAGDAQRLGETRLRHAEYYANRAEELELDLIGERQSGAYRAIVDDDDNFRTAMAFTLAETDHLAHGVRIAASLGRYWDLNGSLSEGTAG